MKILKQKRYIQKGPRIGIDYARPADRHAARRFWIDKKYIDDVISTYTTGRMLSDE
jgi:hypothetical protein